MVVCPGWSVSVSQVTVMLLAASIGSDTVSPEIVTLPVFSTAKVYVNSSPTSVRPLAFRSLTGPGLFSNVNSALETNWVSEAVAVTDVPLPDSP